MKKAREAEGLGVSEKEKGRWGAGQMAQMPQEVKMQHYRKPSEYGSSVLDDTINHIDSTNSKVESTMRRFVSDQH